MSVVGIIAEYNPLHLGHVHHLETARAITGAHGLICVLSSNFVQRGEPALVSKWARAQMALSSGADLVIELPSAFSCASAEYFSAGAVSVLHNTGIVDYLCFGSEEGNIGVLETAAEQFAFESEPFKENLKEGLNGGLSYAVARQKALESVLSDLKRNNDSCDYENKADSIVNAISKPNNILGIEYIKALIRMNSPIKPVTIKRIGQGYNSMKHTSSYASATAIRSHIQELSAGNLLCDTDAFLHNNLSPECLKTLLGEFNSGRGPVFPQAFENILLYAFRTKSVSEIRSLPYMEEGLENRLKQAAQKSASYDELVRRVVTKRYPASRIRRILFSMLTGMTGEFLEELKNNGYAQYIKILGFNETGRALLADIKKKARLPIITKPASYGELDSRPAEKLFEYETKATDVYALGFRSSIERIGGKEFTTSPICPK
ncbi:MAG: nucleotidyltransferase [Acetivibrionales bacterium]